MEIDLWAQFRDYRPAITFACTLAEIDRNRIGNALFSRDSRLLVTSPSSRKTAHSCSKLGNGRHPPLLVAVFRRSRSLVVPKGGTVQQQRPGNTNMEVSVLGQIQSHVAIVTGGRRGLGRAMVLGLGQAGIHVVATAARERTEIEAVAAEVRQGCGESRVPPLVADVSYEDDCAEVVDAAIKRFGRLDVLVNNAGRGMKYVSNEFLTEPTRFWEVAPETWLGQGG